MDGPNAISSASFAALGGTAVVAVADPEALDDAVVAAGVIVDRFDLACSSFRGDSELAAVNSSAGKPVEVSDLFIDAVEAAVRGARLTDGASTRRSGRRSLPMAISTRPDPSPRARGCRLVW